MVEREESYRWGVAEIYSAPLFYTPRPFIPATGGLTKSTVREEIMLDGFEFVYFVKPGEVFTSIDDLQKEKVVFGRDPIAAAKEFVETTPDAHKVIIVNYGKHGKPKSDFAVSPEKPEDGEVLSHNPQTGKWEPRQPANHRVANSSGESDAEMLKSVITSTKSIPPEINPEEKAAVRKKRKASLENQIMPRGKEPQFVCKRCGKDVDWLRYHRQEKMFELSCHGDGYALVALKDTDEGRKFEIVQDSNWVLIR